MSEHEWGISEVDIYRRIAELLADDREAALATIVSVDGSAYRRPGAKMLVAADGDSYGLITAGCIEDEVRELVEAVLGAGEPHVETYDLMEDDDIWGLGLGCNGIIDVLVEPISTDFATLIDAVSMRRPIGQLTIVGESEAIGARAYFQDGEWIAVDDAIPDWVLEEVAGATKTLIAEDKAETITVEAGDTTMQVFIEGIQPAPRLLVLGSGPDVGPLVELGRKNGYDVGVVSFRGAVDIEARFPVANSHYSTKPAMLSDEVPLDGQTYAVVMTHNFLDDRIAMGELLDADVPYIGLMGPRKRFAEMSEDFAAEGRHFSEEEMSRIFTPVGLDLGSGSPYGIATSVIAEVMAVASGRTPQHLKTREGPIHDRASLEAIK